MILLFLYIIFIIIPVVAVVIIKKKNKEYWPVKRIDQVGGLFNIALIGVYTALSIASFVLAFATGMSLSSYPDSVNKQLVDIYLKILFFMPVFSAVSLSLSAILRIKGKSRMSFCIQFLPLIIFILVIQLL